MQYAWCALIMQCIQSSSLAEGPQDEHLLFSETPSGEQFQLLAEQPRVEEGDAENTPDRR
jgi:hypothetical protein